jgi:hypothetical protein
MCDPPAQNQSDVALSKLLKKNWFSCDHPSVFNTHNVEHLCTCISLRGHAMFKGKPPPGVVRGWLNHCRLYPQSNEHTHAGIPGVSRS